MLPSAGSTISGRSVGTRPSLGPAGVPGAAGDGTDPTAAGRLGLLGLMAAMVMAAERDAMTNATPAHLILEISGVPSVAGPPLAVLRRVVDVALADAMRRPEARDRLSASSMDPDCGTLGAK